MSTCTCDDVDRLNDLCLLMDAEDFSAATIIDDIIGAEDPVRALAKLLLLRDNGGDMGRARARAAFRKGGKPTAEAEAEVAKLMAEIWPEVLTDLAAEAWGFCRMGCKHAQPCASCLHAAARARVDAKASSHEEE